MGEGRDWLALIVLCAANLLAGLLEVFLVPTYVGRWVAPVSVVLAVGGNVLAPRLGRILVDTGAGAFAPVLAWLIPVLGVALIARPEGDIVIRGGNAEQWVYYGVLLGGAIAGFLSAATALPARRGNNPG